MPINFDGPNLTITLASGVSEVKVIDIYSDWKEWVLAGNAGYPAAFRPVGGDPLSSIINAGSYFFMNNVDGWRIKPPEEDITIYLTGNLAVEDTTLPAILPTTDPFTAAILGLQPVTQGVTEVMGSQLAFGSFNGGVWVDQTSSNNGTGADSNGNPIGNAMAPVNNFTDARAISLLRGLPSVFYVIGNATLDTGDNVSGFTLIGQNPSRWVLTVNAGAETVGCEVSECYLTGNLDGGTIVKNCVIDNLNYINGFVYNTMLNPGTITLGGSDTAHFLNCYSGVPGSGTPCIDMNGAGAEDTPLAVRNYNGGICLKQKTGTAACTVDLASGQVRIDDTCVAGTVVVRGDGKVVRDLDDTHMLSGTYNGALTLVNECSNVFHSHQLEAVADAVWDEDITTHTTTNSTGEALGNAGGGSSPTTIAAAVWDKLQSAHTTPGSFGEVASEIASILTDTDTTIPGLIAALNDFNPALDTVAHVTLVDTTTTNTDMRGTDGAYTGTPPTTTQIADSVWDETQATHLTAGSFGEIATEIATILGDTSTDIPALIGALNDFNPATDTVARVTLVDTVTANSDMVSEAPTAAQIADAIWDEQISEHAIVGSFGEMVAKKLLKLTVWLGMR